MFGGIKESQCFMDPSCRQKPFPDPGGDIGNLAALFIMLLDEGIDIPLGIGNLLHSPVDGPPPGTFGYFVFVEPSGGRPADNPAFQMLQADGAEGGSCDPD